MAELGAFRIHINARVHGMMSTLLARADIDAFLDGGSVDAMVDGLVSSPYAAEMAEALTRYQGADAIEDGVSRNLINTFAKLRRICRGRYGELVGIFLARWDLGAVKALLRNCHHGLDADTGAASLFPGPSMPVAVQRDLASQDTMEGLVRGLVAWNRELCSALPAALAGYAEEKRLDVLEEVLDRSYFVPNVQRLGGAKDTDSRSLQALLRIEIDRINLRILLEPRPPDKDIEDVVRRLLPQGHLPGHILRSIASAPSPEASVRVLEQTRYAELSEEAGEFTQAHHFAQFERYFEVMLMRALRRMALRQGISIAVLLRYAWLKYNEVMNLRTIARGLAVQLPAARLREEIHHG